MSRPGRVDPHHCKDQPHARTGHRHADRDHSDRQEHDHGRRRRYARSHPDRPWGRPPVGRPLPGTPAGARVRPRWRQTRRYRHRVGDRAHCCRSMGRLPPASNARPRRCGRSHDRFPLRRLTDRRVRRQPWSCRPAHATNSRSGRHGHGRWRRASTLLRLGRPAAGRQTRAHSRAAAGSCSVAVPGRVDPYPADARASR